MPLYEWLSLSSGGMRVDEGLNWGGAPWLSASELSFLFFFCLRQNACLEGVMGRTVSPLSPRKFIYRRPNAQNLTM